MRIWISGGGTAGHVYPALTVLAAAGGPAESVSDERAAAPVEPVWFGRAGSLEAAIVTRRGLPFRALPSGPLLGAGPLALVRSVTRLARGTWQASRAVGAERPDAVLATGGYVSVPLALAARLRGVPLLVYLPDVRPGLAVRLLARLADRLAVTTDAARAYLPDEKVIVTGYPVRPAVRAAERVTARDALGLAPDEPTVLVFGGSQGARRINRALAAAAPALLTRATVIHISGQRGHDEAAAARAALPARLRPRWRLHDYLPSDEMADALAAADLAVSRAGAATLGEYPACGLPAVLVPLPIAGGHQAENARVLAAAGAAVIVPDDALDGARLADEIGRLLDDPERRAAMARAARALDRPDAARAVWNVLANLAGEAGRDRGAAA